MLSSYNLDNKEQAINYIMENPNSLKDFKNNIELYNDLEFNLMIPLSLDIKEKENSVKYLNEKFLRCESFLEKLLKYNISLYPLIEKYIKNKEDFIISLIDKYESSRGIYTYLEPKLQLNKDIIRRIHNYEPLFIYTCKAVSNDKELIKSLIVEDVNFYSVASQNLKKDKEFINYCIDYASKRISLKSVMPFEDSEMLKKLIRVKLEEGESIFDIYSDENFPINLFDKYFHNNIELLKELLKISTYLYESLGRYKENKEIIELIKEDYDCFLSIPSIIFQDSVYIANIIENLGENLIITKDVVNNLYKNKDFNKLFKEMVGEKNPFIGKKEILMSVRIILNKNEKELMTSEIKESNKKNKKLKF